LKIYHVSYNSVYTDATLVVRCWQKRLHQLVHRPYCHAYVAVKFGNGVYFARDFSYSAQKLYSPPDKDGLKYVIQARVLTGEFTLGAQNMIEAPERDQGVRYDSLVNGTNDPTIFVVLLDNRMYPEYIVSFFAQ